MPTLFEMLADMHSQQAEILKLQRELLAHFGPSIMRAPEPKRPHWTQRPENKSRLAAMLRKSARTRAKNGKG
jgi:hypothetical protein